MLLQRGQVSLIQSQASQENQKREEYRDGSVRDRHELQLQVHSRHGIAEMQLLPWKKTGEIKQIPLIPLPKGFVAASPSHCNRSPSLNPFDAAPRHSNSQNFLNRGFSCVWRFRLQKWNPDFTLSGIWEKLLRSLWLSVFWAVVL